MMAGRCQVAPKSCRLIIGKNVICKLSSCCDAICKLSGCCRKVLSASCQLATWKDVNLLSERCDLQVVKFCKLSSCYQAVRLLPESCYLQAVIGRCLLQAVSLLLERCQPAIGKMQPASSRVATGKLLTAIRRRYLQAVNLLYAVGKDVVFRC